MNKQHFIMSMTFILTQDNEVVNCEYIDRKTNQSFAFNSEQVSVTNWNNDEPILILYNSGSGEIPAYVESITNILDHHNQQYKIEPYWPE